MLSLRGSTMPAFQGFVPENPNKSVERISEFFQWLRTPEAKNYDTVITDSMSQIANLVLQVMLRKYSHGMQAYGEMAKMVIPWIDQLYYMPEKHVFMICKLGRDAATGYRFPSFDGQQLNTYVPHLFDEILYLDYHTIQGVGNDVRSFRTKGDFNLMARDRSGRLAQFEPPNLTQLFNKAMS